MSIKNVLTPKQSEVIRFDNQERPWMTICEGAVRSGKTIVNNYLLWMHTREFNNAGIKFIITGNTLGTIKRNVLDDLEDTFKVDTRLNRDNMFVMNGNPIYCFGADDVDCEKKIKGFTAYGWLANEITTQHESLVKQALSRCSGKGARIFWDTNPDNPTHYIKTGYIDKSGERNKSGRIRIKSWHFTLDDNTFLDEEYKDNLKSTLSGVFYDRNILGLWVSAEGMIFRDFNLDRVMVGQATSGLRYFGAIDWGFTEKHSTVIVILGEDTIGNIYIVDEWAKWDTDIDEIDEQKKKYVALYGEMPFYCDPARQEYVRKIGGYNALNDVVPGIKLVGSLMKQGRFKIVQGTGNKFLSEIWNYRWNDRTKADEPIKENDDAMDAVRYGIASYMKLQGYRTSHIDVGGGR